MNVITVEEIVLIVNNWKEKVNIIIVTLRKDDIKSGKM